MSGHRAAQDPIAATLSLLQDTHKFEARLKRLNDAEKKLSETTSQYEGIMNLNRSKAAAKRARERAEEVLAEAEAKAKTIIAGADEAASALRQTVQGESALASKEAREKTNKLNERASELSVKEADYQKRVTALARTETSTHNRATKNLAWKKDLERQANSLKAVCSEILA